MTFPLRQFAWTATALLSIGIALMSLRLALPHPPGVAPFIMENPFSTPFLPMHAITASIALLLGAFQFIARRRGGRAAWHRTVGAAYIACCLVSAPAGLILALGSRAGPVATVGFGLLAVIWFYVNAKGLRAVLDRRYAEHGEWMIRSYALTFAAVTLRLYLPLGGALGFDFMDTYRLTAFISWIPNLMIAELWLVSRRQRRLTTTAPA